MSQTFLWIEDRKGKSGYNFWKVFLKTLYPDIILESKINNSELIKAVKKLPEKFHIVIVLRFFSDFTEKDMAKMLGIPEGTVKSRINKAKKLLRKEMKCDG